MRHALTFRSQSFALARLGIRGNARGCFLRVAISGRRRTYQRLGWTASIPAGNPAVRVVLKTVASRNDFAPFRRGLFARIRPHETLFLRSRHIVFTAPSIFSSRSDRGFLPTDNDREVRPALRLARLQSRPNLPKRSIESNHPNPCSLATHNFRRFHE